MITGKIYSCRGTMKNAETLFSPFEFYKIHSAYIVNLDYIARFDRENVYMGEKGIKLPVAQNRFTDFRKAYAAFTMRDIL